MKLLSEKLLLLNQTVVDCLGEFDEKIIVKNFADVAIRVMQADFGFVWFGDVNSENFELIYTSPTMPYTPSAPRKHGVSRHVLAQARPMLYEDISQSDFIHESARPYMKSLAVIPMQYKEKTYGSIFLCFKEILHFEEEDYELGHFIGNSAAQAMRISNLYHDLQEADRKKDNFIAILAHELRNPLAPLLSAAQLLRLKAGNSNARSEALIPGSEVRQFVSIAERQVKIMTRILDDLLDVSRITHGKFHLKKRPLDLITVVHNAVASARPTIENKKHTMTVTLPHESLTVLGDAVRLEQVLVNLLKNASEYTNGAETIDIVVKKEKGRASVCVRDSGIGMNRETLTKIFDSFFRADTSAERSRDGLGLGLMLSKTILEMHGGYITADSEGLGRGSSFTMYLPLHTEQRKNEDDEDNPLMVKKKRILVVDDNRAAADTLAQLLRHYGHEVEVVYDGPAALLSSRRSSHDSALLDIGLPSMGGYELARQLKMTRPAIKLIAISGYGQKEDRRRSEEAGFDYHFVKPVDIQTLLKSI